MQNYSKRLVVPNVDKYHSREATLQLEMSACPSDKFRVNVSYSKILFNFLVNIPLRNKHQFINYFVSLHFICGLTCPCLSPIE